MARFKAPAPAPPTPARSRLSKRDLSHVSRFDDLMRDGAVLTAGSEEVMLKFVRTAKEWQKKWKYSEMERQRLSVVLNEKEIELTGKDYQIKSARNFVEQEQKVRFQAEKERDLLQKQILVIKDFLLADGGKTINNETLEQIKKIDVSGFTSAKPAVFKNLNPLAEESCESILDAEELSFEDSRDDILGASRIKYKRRSSAPKRLSHSFGASHFGNDKIVAKTIVTMGRNGKTQAESFVETHPVTMDIEELKKQRKRSRLSRDPMLDNENNGNDFTPSAPPMETNLYRTPSHNVKRTFSNAGAIPSRQHSFEKKHGLSERCNPCGKRIKFSKPYLKCRDCDTVCHTECKHNVPLPCIAKIAKTPSSRLGNHRYLADFTSPEPPMVPALIDLCVKEVEARGLEESGIYRIPGNEVVANQLLEKLLQGKGAPPRLSCFEIHTITSVIKKFLKSLKDTLIPGSLWKVFVDAATNPDSTLAETDLYQAISELPRPNRDTLAYLMVHFKAVADNSSVNRMTPDNLAVTIGPTIVGFWSTDINEMANESYKQRAVMKALLAISADYWSEFLCPESPQLYGYSQPKPAKRYFKPMSIPSPAEAPPPMTGGPAKRTRSKKLSKNFARVNDIFQSPMI